MPRSSRSRNPNNFRTIDKILTCLKQGFTNPRCQVAGKLSFVPCIQCGDCFDLRFWRLGFWGCCPIFGNLCTPSLNAWSSVRTDIQQCFLCWGVRRLEFAVSNSGWSDIFNELRQCLPVVLRREHLLSRRSYNRGVCRSHGRAVLLSPCDRHTWNLTHTVALHTLNWPRTVLILVGRNEKCVDLFSAKSLDIIAQVLSKHYVARRFEKRQYVVLYPCTGRRASK
jgi:hypothetical protein